MANPWDKLTAESDEAYARFLMYRNLGPTRSVRRCYYRYLQEFDNFQGPPNGVRPPYSWQMESQRQFWRERSVAWDVRNLSAYGQKIVALHSEAIAEIARKNLRAARRLKVGMKGWAELQTSLRTVAEYLTPELLKNVQPPRNGNGNALEPVGAGAKQQPDLG